MMDWNWSSRKLLSHFYYISYTTHTGLIKDFFVFDDALVLTSGKVDSKYHFEILLAQNWYCASLRGCQAQVNLEDIDIELWHVCWESIKEP